MAASTSSSDTALQRSSLLEQIARERREVRILESERALLLSKYNQAGNRSNARKRPRSEIFTAAAALYGGRSLEDDNPGQGIDGATSCSVLANRDSDAAAAAAAASADGTDEERDLLDVLDALQCRVTLESMGQQRQSNQDVVGGSTDSSADAASANLDYDDRVNESILGSVDAESFRLHPVLGGVAFTKVEGPLPSSSFTASGAACVESGVQTRLYILSGHVAGWPNSVGHETIGFQVRAEVSFTRHDARSTNINRVASPPRKAGDEERATVSSVTAKFFPHLRNKSGSKDDESTTPTFSLPFPTDELTELTQLVAKTRSLTQLFRELVSFQHFHQQRTESIERLIDEFGNESIRVESANIFSITNGRRDASGSDGGEESGGLTIKISWSRTFSELGREDDLCVEDCSVVPREDDDNNGKDQDNIGALVETLMDPAGLSSLVHCVGGCEGAVRVMLQAAWDDIPLSS